MRGDDAQRRDVQSELARLGELSEAGAEGEQRIALYGGGEVGERFAHVVDAGALDTEDVAVGGGARGDEVLDAAAAFTSLCHLPRENTAHRPMSRIPAAKRRRLSPPEADGPAPPPSKDHKAAFVANAAKWHLEQDYETRPRKVKKQKENVKLPVRTTEGWIAPPVQAVEEKEEEKADSFVASASENEEEQEETGEEPKIPPRQQVIEAKEELARIAGLLNEDPEEHIGALKTLAALAASNNATVKKLALATQAAIFKDLIPGYRIRPLSEEALGEKVSKEVRKLRNFEQKLVSGYQAYVQHLGKLAKPSPSQHFEHSADIASVAISCACKTLLAVPHFNFRGELLQILIGKLSTRRVDAGFVRCRETLETLFQNDGEGNASLEAVTMLTKMMKAKNYHFDESVLNTFLHLRLLGELSVKASYNSVDKRDDQDYAGKKIKQKREFRTKKLRKQMKENKAIEKEFKEADAAVSHEERDRMQSETLKMVFVAYFRILKARSPKLMGAVLEGLAKYAHLINQDFFGDILEALRDIISTAELAAAAELDDDDDEEEEEDQDDDVLERNLTRESLLCVITAFALLEGQDGTKTASALKLDLSFFITHLYRTLHAVALNPDIEFSAKSLHLPDPNASEAHTPTNKINVQTTIVLLIRSLSSVLLPPTALRAVPPNRIAAFCKQLMTISLHLPEKSCTAMLGLLTQVTKAHGRKVSALWITEERRGDGVFDALKPEIEGSNPFAGTVWEGEILRRHFCPTIREAVVGIEKNVLDAR
ncbi:nucleolar complex protein-like protein 3 [Lentithecium fluviatile CBS 122367]|uniref:Nucleolar complex-associated protein 3 n=1 Tax=Lentithecium fluviatile CBS 122367 TaxID=1168545 RepID=A0A6G1J7P7_9PLEO|nr:nucleolar complex protein-like protein 3 [Lentithecium fluviatile CBS 122367]